MQDLYVRWLKNGFRDTYTYQMKTFDCIYRIFCLRPFKSTAYLNVSKEIAFSYVALSFIVKYRKVASWKVKYMRGKIRE